MRVLITIQYSYDLLKHPFGGLEVHVKNLIEEIPEIDFYVLMPDYFWRNYLLFHYKDGKKIQMEFIPFGKSVKKPLITDTKYQRLFAQVLDYKQIDLVHVHNVIGHTYDIATICKDKQIPVIKSLHDMYDICGNYFQNDFTQQFDNTFLMTEYDLHGNNLMERNHIWLEKTSGFFQDLDMVIAFSQSTIDIYRQFFSISNYQLIPHGVNFEKHQLGSEIVDDKLKIIYFGRVSREKGFDKIITAFNGLEENAYELHIFGMWEPYYLELQAELSQKSNVFIYGRYDLKQLITQYLPQIRPHVTVILSDWPETFNYVMTEAQLLGILPIVSAQGALLEKATTTKFAYVLEENTVANLQLAFKELKSDSEKWKKYQQHYDELTVQSFASMIESYQELYHSFSAKKSMEQEDKMPYFWQTVTYRGFHRILVAISFSGFWQKSKGLREKIKKIIKGKSRV